MAQGNPHPKPFFKRGNRYAVGHGSSQKCLAALEAALEAEGKKRGLTFYQHVAEQAFVDNTILKEVIKRFIPEKVEHSGAMDFNQRIWQAACEKAKEIDARPSGA